ncbi:hypothetical protein [Actinoplanes rectilineatus]|uniref:hypothetical protein n=1 Tax=Actinoplanes rectilineatus TaxID=113571 RepID=UPI0005F2C491|nr:hypothetical protein [Actinoplanes rectilineatus]
MHGDTTREHIALGTQHPAERGLPQHDTEAHTQRRGEHLTYLSLGLTTGLAITALAAVILLDSHVWAEVEYRLLAFVLALCVFSVSITAGVAGQLEKMLRPQRTITRRAAIRADENARRIEANAKLIAENNRLAATLTTGHSDVLAEVQEMRAQMAQVVAAVQKMPTWEDGVKQGMALGRAGASLADLDQLPMSTGKRTEWPNN